MLTKLLHLKNTFEQSSDNLSIFKFKNSLKTIFELWKYLWIKKFDETFFLS